MRRGGQTKEEPPLAHVLDPRLRDNAAVRVTTSRRAAVGGTDSDAASRAAGCQWSSASGCATSHARAGNRLGQRRRAVHREDGAAPQWVGDATATCSDHTGIAHAVAMEHGASCRELYRAMHHHGSRNDAGSRQGSCSSLSATSARHL